VVPAELAVGKTLSIKTFASMMPRAEHPGVLVVVNRHTPAPDNTGTPTTTTPATTPPTTPAPPAYVPEWERTMTPADEARFAAWREDLAKMTSGRLTQGTPTVLPGHLTGRALTPDEQRRVDALNAPPPPPDDKAKAEAATRAQYEERLAALRKDPNYWSDKDPAAHKAIMAEQQRILAALATDDEREEVMQAPLGELRDRFGIEPKLPDALREKWDAETEGTVLGTLAVQGVTAEAARAIHGWYESVFAAHGGDVANIDPVTLESDFRAVAKRAGLAQDLIDALVEYEKQRLGLN
jgi:hypothetical protein